MAVNNSQHNIPRISALFSEMRDVIGDTTTDLIQHFYDSTLAVMKKAVLIAESESDTSPQEQNSLTLDQIIQKVPSKEIQEVVRAQAPFPPQQFKKPLIKLRICPFNDYSQMVALQRLDSPHLQLKQDSFRFSVDPEIRLKEIMKKICRALGLKSKRVQLYPGKFEGHRRKSIIGVATEQPLKMSSRLISVHCAYKSTKYLVYRILKPREDTQEMFKNLQDSLIQSYRKTLDQYFSTYEKKTTQKEQIVSRTPSARKEAAVKPNEPIRGKERLNKGGFIESEMKQGQEGKTIKTVEKLEKCSEELMHSSKWGRGLTFQNSLFFPAGDESKGALTPLHQFYDSRPFGFFNSRMSDSRFSAIGAREDSRTFPPSFFGSNDSQL